MSYPSDADVLFVYDPPPGAAEDAASAAAHAIAEELRRLLGRARPRPAAGRRRRPAPGGPAGPAGPQPRRVPAVLRPLVEGLGGAGAAAGPVRVPATPTLGAEFLALADPVRYPAGGLTREQVIEIRRIKARVDTERLPRGADPATHTKLGRGGLADVEWAVQLLQLRHAARGPGAARHRVPSTRSPPPSDAGLVDPADAAAMAAGWTLAAQVRNALTLVRGRAERPAAPARGRSWPAWSGCSAGGRPGGVPRRVPARGRRSRAAMERVLDA